MSNINSRRLIGGGFGALVEWYDFLVYGLSAPAIAANFFPSSNRTAAMLSTFAVFGVAFLARPIGGALFGYLGDRYGRIRILSWTVLAMGASTLLTGLLPTTQAIGIAAPALLVVLRLVQGSCAGGETSGCLSYILECAPRDRRAVWTAVIGAFGFVPSAIAALIIFGLQAKMGGEDYIAYGWRIPFLVGGLLGGIGIWLRRNLSDPEEYSQAHAGKQENPILSVASKKSLVNVILLVALQATGAYMMQGYMYSYLLQVVKISVGAALLTNAATLTLLAVLLPVCGHFADRYGRKPVLFAGAIWFLITTYPAFLVASTGTVAGAFLGQTLLAIGVAVYAGANFAVTVELFPTSMRQTGHAIAYNLSFALFGGFAPFVSTLLVAETGSSLSPTLLLMAVSLLAFITLFFTPETKGIRLRDSVDSIESTSVSSLGKAANKFTR
ncbi:MFS transporter [Burkholderia sp. Ax-1724]|uniref:MFS transporter n=1 Tax=Burkholderia sp. Ax-1724 TaxID=2608336 RepID=UPI00142431CB|nr:MFS transporter [Burkholderia sp. Ax-1724]NIF56067.1 MHS family MFS transporter [Burkholderia sp. Ax-1724]